MAKKKTAKGMSDEAYRDLLDRSMEELRLKTQAHDATWHMGSADWALDQTTGVLTFTYKTTTASAPAQIIGTFSTKDDTWLWAWDHPSIVDDMTLDAKKVHEYGVKNDRAELTTRKLKCDEYQAWEFTALACHLCEAQGAYRGPAGTAMVFMTFGKVTLTKTEVKGKRGRK